MSRNFTLIAMPGRLEGEPRIAVELIIVSLAWEVGMDGISFFVGLKVMISGLGMLCIYIYV